MELEDLCLKYLHPDAYSKLSQRVAKNKRDRDKYIEDVTEIISDRLKEYDIQATIEGRA